MAQHSQQMESQANHMSVPWHEFNGTTDKSLVTKASLEDKSSLVCRVGIMLLSCGTGVWRVRSSMNKISKELGITCIVDIGLTALHCTCFDGDNNTTHALSLPSTGVNTYKLNRMERFVHHFEQDCLQLTVEEVHQKLDEIDRDHTGHSPLILGLASGVACAAFTFLLGGGLIEMFCALLGAGVGNYVRSLLIKRKETLVLYTGAGVAAACVVYAAVLALLEAALGVSDHHEVGYICSMLFVIPGFPFITSGIDLAKLDIRSGLERLTYAIIIVATATAVGWLLALGIHLQPGNFEPLGLDAGTHMWLRLIASFFGVFGFSIMFNSSGKMAATAGLIGAVANTLRLELVELVAFPPGAAAFVGALTAGLLASLIKTHVGYPRISLTVPSIVIMVPGLYLYRAVYYLGISQMTDSITWFLSAFIIIAALPFGLIFARILNDKDFRHCN